MADQRILDAIPHRSPMLLIDEIESIESDKITCLKSFDADEYFFQGHFPGNPIVPGVILCECAAQSGAVLLFHANQGLENQTPLLTRMSDVKLKKVIKPGDQISISVSLDEQISTAFLMSAQIRIAGKLAVSLKFTCTTQ